VPLPSAVLTKDVGDWCCAFCKKHNPAETLVRIYKHPEGYDVAYHCAEHPICKSFMKSGKFCQNHEEGIDVQECGDIPF
jgi:hypothetical protein